MDIETIDAILSKLKISIGFFSFFYLLKSTKKLIELQRLINDLENEQKMLGV